VSIDESQVPQDIARLWDSVDEELRVQLAGRQIDLPLETIREIAYGGAVQLDYAYKLTWMPRWEGSSSLPAGVNATDPANGAG
jgi:hypothetical protein